MDNSVGLRERFGAIVAENRRARRWSQDRLGAELARQARLAGRYDVPPVSRQTVYRWEMGRHWPDPVNGYLLCRLFQRDPEELHLEGIVTPAVVARWERRDTLAAQALIRRAGPMSAIGTDRAPDWERLGYFMRAMRPVDRATVEDEWFLTRRLLADRRRMRTLSVLELLIEHVVRLRQLCARTEDERLHRELSVMLGQTLVGAAGNWAGLTDFGMATASLHEAAARGTEIGEEWMRITALLSLAQLSGIHPMAPWTPAARLALLKDIEAGTVGAPPEVRVWVHATRAQIYALADRPAEAQRALELAARAQASVVGEDFYFACVDPGYLAIQQASATLQAGRPREAAALFRPIAEQIPAADLTIRAWLMVYVAAAEASAGDLEHAGPSLDAARNLAQQVDCPLLEHSVERIATRQPWAADLRRHQLATAL